MSQDTDPTVPVYGTDDFWTWAGDEARRFSGDLSAPAEEEIGRNLFNRILSAAAMMPSMMAEDLVKVQPMDGPVGIAFHLNYFTETSEEQILVDKKRNSAIV